jgi:hypothetical protein
MAEAWNTLNGLIQFNDKNLADLNVSDLLDKAPLLQVLNAQAASQKTVHYYLKQTVASDAGFRAALAGRAKTNSQDEKVTVTLQIIDGTFSTDVALADAYKGGRDAWLQIELMRTMKQLMFVLERQTIYGTKQQTGGGYLSSAAGFTGLANSADLDQIADDMVIAASTAGTTGDSQTSVWFLRNTPDDVSMVLGQDGRFVIEDEPTIIEKTPDGDTETQTYPALYVPVTGYAGLQLGGKYSAARLCNIETKLTSDDMYDAISLFPSSSQPNVIVMNRKAMKLLRNSLTATNPTGTPAPRPTNWDGIPIVVTDSVRSDEPVIS